MSMPELEAETVFHAHYRYGRAFVCHAHPSAGAGHDHDGWTLLQTLNEPPMLVDDGGRRLPGELTPMEALTKKTRSSFDER